MENTLFLRKYTAAVDAHGAPVEQRRSRSGLVYRAKEMETGRDVTVEVVPASSLNADVRAQLETEAASARELNHPNIPALYDFGIEDEKLIYVTEDLDGTTLDEWIRDHGPMDSAAVLRVALQILGALGAAAYHRILHHAINPQNVLIVPGQTTDGGWPLVKLLHLIGVAPSAGSPLSPSGIPDNSASFASPEQLQTGAVDFRSEIYSLGCTLFFLFTGAVPFSNAGETPDARQAATRRTIERIRGLPKDARQLLVRMLSSDPNERPLDPLATYDVLQESLAQVERSGARARKLGIPATKPLSAITAPVTPRRLPVKALAIAAALLLLATVAAVVLPGLFRRNGVARSKAGVEEIGVPVGIPDASAAPVAAREPVASAPVATAVTSSSTPALANDAEEPQTLTSTAGREDQVASNPPAQSQAISSAARDSARDPAGSSPTIAAAPIAEQPSQLARVEAAPSTPEPAASVASPNVPSDAAAASSTTLAEQSTAAQKSVAPTERAEIARKTERAADRTDSITASTSSKKVADKKVTVRKAEPVSDEKQPPVPRGAVRAQFIGTTPDGEWVFGLPSEKEGVLKLRDAKKSEKRARRAPVEPEPNDQPAPRVLPALPPDG